MPLDALNVIISVPVVTMSEDMTSTERARRIVEYYTQGAICAAEVWYQFVDQTTPETFADFILRKIVAQGWVGVEPRPVELMPKRPGTAGKGIEEALRIVSSRFQGLMNECLFTLTRPR